VYLYQYLSLVRTFPSYRFFYWEISAGADAPIPCGKRKNDEEKNAMPAPKSPALVALTHEVLNRDRFETLSDLCETLKLRAARLRIPYDATSITEALTAVKHGRPLLRQTTPRVLTRRTAETRLPDWKMRQTGDNDDA